MKSTAQGRVPFSFMLRRSPVALWFLLAIGLLALFLLSTFLLSKGVFDTSTAQIEQWLLGRPITRADCVLYEWRNLGNVTLVGCFTLGIGGVCIMLGYRWTVVIYLLLLLLVGGIVELAGKRALTQSVPRAVHESTSVFNCPQIQEQPQSVQVSAALGMWWTVPEISASFVERVQERASHPFFTQDYLASSYPGGHAMRTSFLGMLLCWLCWQHIRRPLIRVPLMILALLLALGIGFIQFYLGLHLITDTIAGYLFGFASACCAIGLLLLNGPPEHKISS